MAQVSIIKNLFFRLLENSERKHIAQPIINWLIVGLIILNSFAVALTTVDSFKTDYMDVLASFENFSIASTVRFKSISK